MRLIDGLFSFLSNFFPVGLLEFTILQDYVINIFPTENASPPPSLFGFRIDLVVSHDTVTPSTSHIEPLSQNNILPKLRRCLALFMYAFQPRY